jgi:hypothetical protein
MWFLVCTCFTKDRQVVGLAPTWRLDIKSSRARHRKKPQHHVQAKLESWRETESQICSTSEWMPTWSHIKDRSMVRKGHVRYQGRKWSPVRRAKRQTGSAKILVSGLVVESSCTWLTLDVGLGYLSPSWWLLEAGRGSIQSNRLNNPISTKQYAIPHPRPAHLF